MQGTGTTCKANSPHEARVQFIILQMSEVMLAQISDAKSARVSLPKPTTCDNATHIEKCDYFCMKTRSQIKSDDLCLSATFVCFLSILPGRECWRVVLGNMFKLDSQFFGRLYHFQGIIANCLNFAVVGTSGATTAAHTTDRTTLDKFTQDNYYQRRANYELSTCRNTRSNA